MGAEELHDLQLLHGRQAFPSGFSSRMLRRLDPGGKSGVSAVNVNSVFVDFL